MVTQQRAVVCIEAGGQVNCQSHASMRVEQPQRLGNNALGATRGAQSQQRIDGQIGMRAWRQSGLDGDARVLGAGQRRRGIGRPLRRRSNRRDADPLAGAVQVQGGLEAVAAVVAWPGGDPDALGMRCQCQRQPRQSVPSGLHQGVRTAARRRECFDLT